MHYEYAIDPESITEDYKTFRFIMSQFGFSKGRLISMFSKKWKREVIELINKFESPKERKIATELLKKELYIKSKRDYDASLPWIDASVKAHHIRPFHAIIANSISQEIFPDIISTSSLWEGEQQKFKVLRECRIVKTPKNFAKATKILIENSDEIIFIDPYLQKDHYEPLRAMLNCAHSDAKSAQYITEALSKKYRNVEENIKKELLEEKINTFKKDLPRYIPHGLSLKITLLNSDSLFRLHNRYVITNKGGIKFPDGLTEIKNARDEINLMEDETYKTVYDEFTTELDRSLIVQEIEITGRG